MWAQWILQGRFGLDAEAKVRQLEQLARTRDRLLDAANIVEGEAVLDVGCGDGLIGFGALSRGAGQVTFSDVSGDLIAESRRIATDLGVLERSRFLITPADDLSSVPDG